MTTWSSTDFAAAVQRLSSQQADDSTSQDAQRAARRTGGVVVHEDMNGVLVLMPDASAMIVEHETGLVQIADERWRLMALVKGARQFTSLKRWAPVKPSGAKSCPACNGTGSILGG